ncbi:MAG: hypothetical protein ABWJ98_04170 [Hydrogenothermaceae bacterium]
MIDIMKKLLALFLIIVVSLIVRELITQREFIKVAEKQSGLDAIKFYEKVILSYVPFSPYNKKAVESIKDICKTLQKEDEKLYCYETLRTDLIQIKSFYQPFSDVLYEITPEIAKLRANQMIEWEGSNYSKSDFDRLYKAQLNLLNYDNSPSNFWSFITVLSFMMWISSVVLAIYKNVIVGSFGFLIFFTLWILGLFMA